MESLRDKFEKSGCKTTKTVEGCHYCSTVYLSGILLSDFFSTKNRCVHNTGTLIGVGLVCKKILSGGVRTSLMLFHPSRETRVELPTCRCWRRNS